MSQYQALGLTLVCEIPVILFLVRDRAFFKVFIIAATASMITHPFAWKMSLLLSSAEYQTGVVVIEVCVVIVEALWYQVWLRLGVWRSLLYSATANTASFMIGWLIW
jgi:hypothetical protein